MADCKICSTLCKMDITKTSDEIDLIDSKRYREIIGTLIYMMLATRPKICYTVTSKIKLFPINEGKTRLTLFKRHNQSVTNI